VCDDCENDENDKDCKECEETVCAQSKEECKADKENGNKMSDSCKNSKKLCERDFCNDGGFGMNSHICKPWRDKEALQLAPPISEHTLVENGAVDGSLWQIKGDWLQGFDADGWYLEQTGQEKCMRWPVTTIQDFSMTATVKLKNMGVTAAGLQFQGEEKQGYFGLDGSENYLFVEGAFFSEDRAKYVNLNPIQEGNQFTLEVLQDEGVMKVSIDGKEVYNTTGKELEAINALALCPMRATMYIYDWRLMEKQKSIGENGSKRHLFENRVVDSLQGKEKWIKPQVDAMKLKEDL
jgi:hypothetical protein